MLLLDVVVFVIGVGLLAAGAEGLVRGGARLGLAFRVSPLVIGLTIVAFGTSMPELMVSLAASLRGESDIAIGNVVGSNIFNVLGILGPAAVLAPLVVNAAIVRRDVPVMILASILLPLMSFDGGIGRIDGVLLFAGIVAYTVYSYYISRRETAAIVEEARESLPETLPRKSLWWDVLLVAAGLVLLVVGAQMLIASAVPIARFMGVSERVIALTLVAAGTSMPEFATSVVATIRRQTDIAVGNVVGSNIFNILSILGLSSLAHPLRVNPDILRVDIPIMLLVSVVTLLMVTTHRRITRAEGLVLVAGLVAYYGYLIVSGRPG